MKKLNFGNMASIQGAQAAVDDQYRRQINESRFKAARDYQAGQQAQYQFSEMAKEAFYQGGKKGLDPTIADAYNQQGNMYTMLAQQLQYTDPDKYGETVQRFMSTVEDPRKLANELRRTQIMADADITKANIYASGNNNMSTGFSNAMLPSQNGLPNRVNQPTGSLFDFGAGAVRGLMGQR